MKISIGLPSTLSHVTGSLLLDWAREADAGPFTSLAVIDRLVYHNYDAFTTLAAAAGATKRIRLMTGILLAPLYPAALLAKQLASLDALSGGRLTAGLGVGMREDDFNAVSAPFHHRGKYFDAQLETMQHVWSGQALNEDAMAIGPQSMQPGGPELLLGGISPAALRRLGRWGDGYIAGTMPIDSVNQMYRMAEQTWREADRAGKPRLLACAYFALGPNASERARDDLGHYYAFSGPFAQVVMEHALADTASSIKVMIERFQQLGTDELTFFPCIAELDQVQRLADLVN